METYVNGKETDYFSGMSVLEEVRPLGMTGRVGRWIVELAEEFRTQQLEFDPLLDFPRDI